MMVHIVVIDFEDGPRIGISQIVAVYFDPLLAAMRAQEEEGKVVDMQVQ